MFETPDNCQLLIPENNEVLFAGVEWLMRKARIMESERAFGEMNLRLVVKDGKFELAEFAERDVFKPLKKNLEKNK